MEIRDEHRRTEHRAEPKLLSWDRHTSTPAFALAVVYLIAWSVLVLNDDLSSGWKIALLASMIVIWSPSSSTTSCGSRSRRRGRACVRVLASARPARRDPALHAAGRPADAPELGALFQRRAAAAQRVRILLLAGAFVVVYVYTIALAVYNVERDAPARPSTASATPSGGPA